MPLVEWNIFQIRRFEISDCIIAIAFFRICSINLEPYPFFVESFLHPVSLSTNKAHGDGNCLTAQKLQTLLLAAIEILFAVTMQLMHYRQAYSEENTKKQPQNTPQYSI